MVTTAQAAAGTQDYTAASYTRYAKERAAARTASAGAGSYFKTTGGYTGYASGGVSAIKEGPSVQYGGTAKATDYTYLQGVTGTPVSESIKQQSQPSVPSNAVPISGALAEKIQQQSLRQDVQYYATPENPLMIAYNRSVLNPQIQSSGQGYYKSSGAKQFPNAFQQGTYTAAPQQDFFRQKAAEYGYQSQYGKTYETRLFAGGAAFATSFFGDVTLPFRNPVQFGQEFVGFWKNVFTQPAATFQTALETAQANPPGFFGSLAASYTLGKLGSEALGRFSPVRVEKVLDLNVPKAAPVFQEVESLAGGRKVYSGVDAFSSQERGMLAGYKITYPSFPSGKQTGFRFFAPSGSAPSSSLFLTSPAYAKFLEQNPLYADLLSTRLEVSPSGPVEFTTKTVVVKEAGRTIVKTVQEPVPSGAQFEIPLSSGTSEPRIPPAPSGGGGGELPLNVPNPFGKLQSLSSNRGNLFGSQKTGLYLVQEYEPAPTFSVFPTQNFRVSPFGGFSPPFLSLPIGKQPVILQQPRVFSSLAPSAGSLLVSSPKVFSSPVLLGQQSLNQGGFLSLRNAPSSLLGTGSNVALSSAQSISVASVQAQSQAQSLVQGQVQSGLSLSLLVGTQQLLPTNILGFSFRERRRAGVKKKGKKVRVGKVPSFAFGALPDLRSVSVTEAALGPGRRAVAPRLTPGVRALSEAAFRGFSTGFVPTEQIRRGRVKLPRLLL